MIYLSRADVESLDVPMREILAHVERSFRLKGEGKTEMPAKVAVHPRPDGFIHAMPAYVEEVESAGIKWVGGFAQNVGKGLPYISGLIILNDTDTGLPVAVMDCTWITAMRTGASVGVAAKYLAQADSAVAGFLGCGAQARTSLMALVEALPKLLQVRCCSRTRPSVERFIAEMQSRFEQLEFVACDSAREMIGGADVIVSAIPMTRGQTPIIEQGMFKRGALGVSLDYDVAWGAAAMRQCALIVDDAGQVMATKNHGVYFQEIPEIAGELSDIVCGRRAARQRDDERVLAMNLGIAVHDMVVGRAMYEKALARGRGVNLEL